VEPVVPTVVFVARDRSGVVLLDVKVSLDRDLLVDRLDASPVAIDPGEHTFRFERRASPPVDVALRIAPGEKNRIISAIVDTEPAPASHRERPEPPQPTRPRGTPTGAHVAGALGVLSIGVFAVFSIKGSLELGELRDSCAPQCDPSELDRVKTELRVGDGFLGVGVVSLGVAALWLLAAARSPPTANGGAAALRP
jgi:hypothetical protein